MTFSSLHRVPRRRLRDNIFWMNLNALFGTLWFLYPVGILYFEQITGSFTLAMGIFSFAAVIQIAFEIPLGIVSDKWGRRSLLIIGCIAEFFAAVSYATALNAPLVDGWVWLYLGGALFGFAEACFSGNNYALLHETLAHYRKTNLMAKIMGRNNSMGQIGLATSGLCATLLLWFGCDFRTLILLSLFPFGLGIVAAFMTVEPPKHSISEKNIWAHTLDAVRLMASNKSLRLLAYGEILKQGTGNASHSFMPQFISVVWPTWAVPLYRMGQNLTGAVSFWKAGDIVETFGAARLLFGCDIVSRAMALIAFLCGSILSPFLLFTTQACYAIGMTASNTLQQENFSDTQRSTMGSLISFASSLAGALAALAVGAIADLLSPTSALIIILLCGLPSLWIYKRLYSHHKTL